MRTALRNYTLRALGKSRGRHRKPSPIRQFLAVAIAPIRRAW